MLKWETFNAKSETFNARGKSTNLQALVLGQKLIKSLLVVPFPNGSTCTQANVIMQTNSPDCLLNSPPMSSDEDPLSQPKNEQGLDLSKLSPQELRIYKMYGKLPTTQQILSSKFHDKKYFDSGDYAMQKQLGGPKSGISGVSMRHPNAEKVKEIYNRNSISAGNSGILFNGKLNLLSESKLDEEPAKE